jgi:hypothetical protein
VRIALSLAFLVLLIGMANAQDHSPTPQQREVDYATWVRQYAGTPFKAFFRAYPDDKVWLTVLSVECDDSSPVLSSHTSCPLPTNMAQVSSTGIAAQKHTTCCPGVGGGHGKLKPEEFERLKTLVPELPDDGGHLPPLGRRLLFQVLHKGSIEVRVYDEEKLPDAVKNVVDLAGLRILHQQISPPQ